MEHHNFGATVSILNSRIKGIVSCIEFEYFFECPDNQNSTSCMSADGLAVF
jgi:hypothetical protein